MIKPNDLIRPCFGLSCEAERLIDQEICETWNPVTKTSYVSIKRIIHLPEIASRIPNQGKILDFLRHFYGSRWNIDVIEVPTIDVTLYKFSNLSAVLIKTPRVIKKAYLPWVRSRLKSTQKIKG